MGPGQLGPRQMGPKQMGPRAQLWDSFVRDPFVRDPIRSRAHLSGTHLSGTHLSGTHLSWNHLSETQVSWCLIVRDPYVLESIAEGLQLLESYEWQKAILLFLTKIILCRQTTWPNAGVPHQSVAICRLIFKCLAVGRGSIHACKRVCRNRN